MLPCSSARSGAASAVATRIAAASVVLTVIWIPALFRKPGFLQPLGKPDRHRLIHPATDIDLRIGDVPPGQRQDGADGICEPQMRIGQTLELVLLMLDRLMV